MRTNIDLPSIFKMPVQGPAPYNTLYAVTQWDFVAQENLYDNDTNLHQYSNVVVSSPINIVGYDPNNPVPVQHSTTAFLKTTGPSANDNFLYAIDAIQGVTVADSGNISFLISTAVKCPNLAIPQGIAFAIGPDGAWEIQAALLISSFILTVEPQAAATPPNTGQRAWSQYFNEIVRDVNLLQSDIVHLLGPRKPRPGFFRAKRP